MKFAEVETAKALGMVIAHSAKVAAGRIPKGTVLDAAHLSALEAGGIRRLAVAMPEPGDVGEDDAARRVAAALPRGGLRVEDPRTGRANLYAQCRGLFRVDAQSVRQVNAVDGAITVATLADREHVEPGQMAATVKIIPFAVPGRSVEACERIAGIMEVKAYAARRAFLVQTRLPGTGKGVLDKARRVTEERLGRCDAALRGESRCAHDARSLAESLEAALQDHPDLLLVFGASAVCDEHDVIPAAIRLLGGEVRRVGMPVDPGNLLVLGRLGEAAVLGLPGCARSPKLNGLDWVLRRLCAGECVTADDIAGMGVGGLLDEIYERPRPRTSAAEAPHARGPLAAVLLAAGLSTRMGDKNKLLEDWRGRPLLQHALDALGKAMDRGIVGEAIAVTGNDRERVGKLCADAGLKVVHNADYRSGMASSMAAGVAAVSPECAGAFICLGDMPLVSADLLGELAGAFDPAGGLDIAVPVCGGKRGHPVLFGARHFGALRQAEGDAGGRALLAHHGDSVVQVTAGEEALADFDDPSVFLRRP